MRRGELWSAELAQPAGRRTVLLLSRDEAYGVRSCVTVAPLTSRVRGISTEVQLGSEDGAPPESVANMDTILTIPKSSLTNRISALSPGKLRRVEQALAFSLGINWQ